ncbi:two component system sensor histidine kinase, hybrid [Desulfobacula toluolica Tol2]|uniref:histidine kinase n=1 Tax=Desulfobacula toluolica (strain DSM 7467 / Tol2) TaxID=651182 RepID=K0NIY9_DESTT|nr:two component system sensor histidine kinase, hybrid [Desulfobacula toluolica Tol2]
MLWRLSGKGDFLVKLNKKRKRLLSLSGRCTVCFLTVCVLLSVSFSIVFFITGRKQMMANLQTRLLNIVSVSRYFVDKNSHEGFLDFKKPDTALYRDIQKSLQNIRDEINDIYYVYTMTGNDKGEIVFLVDAEVNPLTAAKIGQVYEEPGNVLKKYFYKMSGPLVEKKIYTDQWGSWLSGYIPLKSTQYPIILGMDISASTIKQYTDKLLIQAALIFFSSFPFILLFGYLIGKTLVNPIIQMTRASEEIGKGNFDQRIFFESDDELGDLGDSLNIMAEQLQNNHAEMEAMIVKYRGLFDNAIEGIFQSSHEGKLITVNKSLAAMTGYGSPGNMLEKIKNMDEDFYAFKEDKKRFLQLIDKDKKVYGFRFQIRRNDNSFFWAEMNTRYIESEGLFEGRILDISERLEVEKAENERLAALASSNAKSKFLANMSHEIRTPLNAVIGLGDLLRRTALSEKQEQYLSKMNSSSHALLALINDILDFSKIEAGHLELEAIPFSLYEVIENLTEMFGLKANEKEIEFLVAIEKGIPNALIGDPTRLGQILINLTGNALKFIQKGEIVIKAGLEEEKEDGSLVFGFSVKDTGPGIEPSRINSIFDSFTQEDQSVTRKYGGTGLGLAITKQLVEIMGGDISVESKLGEGSKFSFTVCFKSQPLDKQLIINPPKDLRGLSVLVVDDNQAAREIISEIIVSFQMKVETASSGEQALFMLENGNNTYDLILLDWKMPGMNGIETARQIKRGVKLDKLPIICMISAYGREDLMQEADRSFLDVFLHKPINPSLLFNSIMEIYGRKRQDENFQENSFQEGDFLGSAQKNTAAIPHIKGNILLVEDNTINKEIALEWLTQAGLNVLCVENGREAIDQLEARPFDLVLMDIQMPVMDGLEATRILRSRKKFNSLPIIAMTAHALSGDREKGIEAGMNDYITKPIDPALLFKTLSIYLKPFLRSGRINSSKKSLPLHLTDIAGIDLATGLFRSNNNTLLYEKLLKSFYNDFFDASEKIKTMKNEKKYDDLKRYLHSIKGIAANLGAQNLSDKAADLETVPDFSGKENKEFLKEIKKVMEGLADFCKKTKQEIQTDLNLPPQPPSVIDVNTFINLLQEVEHDIFDDLNSVNRYINKHEHSFQYYLGAESFDLLKSYLSDFALEEAEEKIQSIIDHLTSGVNA